MTPLRHVRLYFQLSVLLLVERASYSQHIQLKMQPSTLLLPVNTNGTFSCKAQCDHACNAFWIINGSKILPAGRPRMHYQILGNTSVGYTTILTVNASNSFNNTNINCRYEPTGDRFGNVQSTTTAVLFVIPEPPISPNPKVVRNTTHVTLMWSPPFLWPGHRIEYYNVSFISSERESSYHRIQNNSSYENKIMSFAVDISTAHQSELSCINITFIISAFEIPHASLQTFNVSDWTWTLPQSLVFTLPAINASVLYKADGTPVSVEVYIQLQRFEFNCRYQELSLTLLIRNNEGDLETEKDASQHLSSDIVREVIVFEFKRNETYTLQLLVEAYSHTITTNKHYFYICPKNNTTTCGTCDTPKAMIINSKVTGTLPYKVAMGILAVITTVVFTTLIILLACLCMSQRRGMRDMKLSESKVRACNVMVHNPIYDGDGPLYESVHNKQSHPQDAASQYDSIHYAEATFTFQDSSYHSGNRYVDQPVHIHNNYLFTNTDNTTDNSHGICANSPNDTTCTSMASTKKMTLKKNGQVRNKLHLTLSLPRSDCIPMKEIQSAFPKSSEIQAEVADETYTVMSPAGAVHLKSSNFTSVDDSKLHGDDVQQSY